MRWWRRFQWKKEAPEAPAPEGEGDESAAPQSPQGHRRRKAARYDYREKLRIKCAGWSDFSELFSADVSRTGIFVQSASPADIGDKVTILVQLPGGEDVDITATVARRVDSTMGRHGVGLGLHIDPPTGKAAEAYRALLERAEEAAPRPETAEFDLVDEDDILPLDDSELLELNTPPERTIEQATQPTPSFEPAAPPPISQKRSGIIVGIDLGTTYTSVAAVVGSKVIILPRDDGSKSTPSVLSFPDRDTIVVGERERMVIDPAHTVVSPKRILGRPFREAEVERYTGQAPFRTLEGPDGSVLIEMWGDPYAIPQLVGFLLKDARDLAEAHLGQRIDQAVVSVPISFDKHRIAHLRRAGQMAGLDIVAVIDEPSAAALANRFDPGFGGVVGVYDFGGGTFDFSVVDVSQGDFRVLATSGDTWLGGDDFDYVLASAAANQFWRKHQVDLKSSALEWQRLLFSCERAKRALTRQEEAAITVPEVLRTATGMVDLNFTINRAILEHAASPIIHQSLETCVEALGAAQVGVSDLSAIYLSGGTTYIPCVSKAVAEYFGVPVRTGVPPEHAVCLGAAIHAAQLQLQSAAPTLESR